MKENHELTTAQEAFRRGSTSYHGKRTLTAKAILKAIKENPGMTRPEILAAIGAESGWGGFDVLTKNKMAYSTGSPAKWFSTGTNPR